MDWMSCHPAACGRSSTRNGFSWGDSPGACTGRSSRAGAARETWKSTEFWSCLRPAARPEAARELCPGADAELRVDLREVRFDGTDGHEQPGCDLLVRESLGDQIG